MDRTRTGRGTPQGTRLPVLSGPLFSRDMDVFVSKYCLSVGCLRARPPARSPHASLRLGVVDLEARPCPPGPTAPATLAARGVVPGCIKKCYAGTNRGQEGSPPYTPSASDSRSALRVRVAANPPGSNPRVGGPPFSHTPGRCPAVPKHRRSAFANATPSKRRVREDCCPPGPGASRRGAVSLLALDGGVSGVF